jgi:hypothetical protein
LNDREIPVDARGRAVVIELDNAVEGWGTEGIGKGKRIGEGEEGRGKDQVRELAKLAFD